MHRKNVHIAEPCDASWNEMTGDDTRRFCDHCTKHVHNLSEMPRSEATRLITSGQNLCVRYSHTPSGRIQFKTRVVPATAPAAQLRGARALTAAAVSIAALIGCDRPLAESDRQEPPVEPTLAGGIGEAPEMLGQAVEMGEPTIEEPCEGSAAPEGSGLTTTTVQPGPSIELMVQGELPAPEHFNTTTSGTEQPCEGSAAGNEKDGPGSALGDVGFNDHAVAGMMAFEPPTVEAEEPQPPVRMGRVSMPRPSWTPEEAEANAGAQLEPFGIVVDDTEIDDAQVQ